MKRIVQCPKCEAKLAIFDLGKPISQKCPKCGNAFVVDSDAGKTKMPKTPPAPSSAAAEGAPAPDPATTPSVAPAAVPAAPAPAAAPIAEPSIKPADAPAAVQTPAPAAVPAASAPAAVPAAAPVPAAVPAAAPAEPAAKPADAQATVASAPTAAPAEPAAKPADAPAASPGANRKEITLKKPAPRAAAKPASATAPEPHTPEIPHCGVSFLHVVAIIGLLILSIILQVMNKKASQRSAYDLAERLNRIEAKLQAPHP